MLIVHLLYNNYLGFNTYTEFQAFSSSDVTGRDVKNKISKLQMKYQRWSMFLDTKKVIYYSTNEYKTVTTVFLFRLQQI